MRQVGLTRWLNRPELPFWTTGEAHARPAPEQRFRRTEQEVQVPGVQPKSVFQLVGAGQVGRGSLHGMAALHRLADAGFRIWPFDPPALPLVVEIFPRVLTGPVRKNSPSQRERYLGTVPMRPDLGRLAVASEDAFDAAISAVVMTARVEELRALPDAPGYALEGKIWQPRDPFALGTGSHLPEGAYGDLGTTVAAVIREAAARGESATAQAEQILDMLRRRGLPGRQGRPAARLRCAPRGIQTSNRQIRGLA